MLQPPFDLHVLGTPPAFILSQDQTLRKKFLTFSGVRYGLLTKLNFRLSSYHSSVVKVPLASEGQILLATSLPVKAEAIKLPMFSINFPGQHRLISRRPCQAWSSCTNLFSLVIDPHYFSKISSQFGTYILRKSLQVVKGFGRLIFPVFWRLVFASRHRLNLPAFPRLRSEVVLFGFQRSAFQLNRAASFRQRAGLYTHPGACQGIQGPISEIGPGFAGFAPNGTALATGTNQPPDSSRI